MKHELNHHTACTHRSLPHQRRPRWRVPFRLLPSIPSRTSPFSSSAAVRRPRVGILREQGSNGDREMAAAFTSAGFEAWDLTVHDLLQGAVSLEGMDGLAFVGGFSYGDALGSGACVQWRRVPARGHGDIDLCIHSVDRS